jgi:hypothetical protein
VLDNGRAGPVVDVCAARKISRELLVPEVRSPAARARSGDGLQEPSIEQERTHTDPVCQAVQKHLSELPADACHRISCAIDARGHREYDCAFRSGPNMNRSERCIHGVLAFCAEIGRGEIGVSGGSGSLNAIAQCQPSREPSPDCST